jgi:hypothetical protein
MLMDVVFLSPLVLLVGLFMVIIFNGISGSSRMVTTFAGTLYYDPQNYNLNLS